ncbi:hypothetical protein [Aminobacter aminovorans]|uniref:Uncharacterized protein n=1 Tax=Aminobacter aminovorans TaxID=83263 RepID=A0AAC8YSJ5_AMIAI|nr:hypothetical protein [Aminobacter aminovorans]AMS43419.1 hypothetical protein AA2016_4507 [Aminobacter aminovorans]MBB3705444.1 hypothetical protein [Aminobacter aminovorans]WMC98753.1 hypothetical protein RAR13_08690 [Aminobacter aminovorans]
MVRTFRSFFFGGLAMLAAAMFLSMPASALEREAGLYSASPAVYVYVLPDVAPIDAILVAERRHELRNRDAHAVAYTVANQPLTQWRIAVDSYSRIDPHIAVV